MFEPVFKARGLVRVVVVFDMNRCGCVDATSKENAEKRGNLWVVGKWHRDDERGLQAKLDNEFHILTEAYRRIGGNDLAGCAYNYEYKAYIK